MKSENAQHTEVFFRAIADTLDSSLCVIDASGAILYTNRSWEQFGRNNGASPCSLQHPGNYLSICDRAARQKSETAGQAGSGLRALIRGEIGEFRLEYPCHSPDEKRWFSLRARRLQWSDQPLFLLNHSDITDRKLAELEVRRLSLTDPLTQLANRRQFSRFLASSWQEHLRDQQSLALILLDLDHFKRLNDSQGHQAGDAGLVRVADQLHPRARRTGDLAARYGGEEMALILRHTPPAAARTIAEELRVAIAELGIPNADSPVAPQLTASLGVASLIPRAPHREEDLIRAADQALYRAKAAGRNRVCMAPPELQGQRQPAQQRNAG